MTTTRLARLARLTRLTRLARLSVSLFIIHFSLFISCALRAQELPSQITAVTVYTDRAIVTRSAHLDLPAGDTTITLDKFPAALLDASVQVRGRGTATATILDVTTALTYTDKVDPATQPRVRDLQDQITALDKTLRALADRETILRQQTTLVDKIENAIAAPPGKDTASQPKLDDMPKLMSFTQDTRAHLAAQRQELADQTAETTAARNALQKQINEILRGADAAKSYKTVTVRLNAANPGALDLAVAYTIPGTANWTPSYDARLRTDTADLELSYNGIVRQTTGEDWKNVALTLSTARPALGGGAPKNHPWFVDVIEPRPAPAPTPAGVVNTTGYYNYSGNSAALGANSRSSNNALMFGNGDAINGSQLYASNTTLNTITGTISNAAYATATVDTAPTSASFKIAAPATILSDNTPQKVSITTTKLAAELQHEATPALQETTYWIAYVKNTTDFPLLAGAANIFLDDAFVATSQLKTVMPSEKFQLALGADEAVSIKRRLVNRYAENTGLTGRGRRVTYEYQTTITNNKKTTIHMVFTEALPKSKNEKITVNLLTPAPRDVGTPDKRGPEVTLEEDNILWWRIDIKPGEKRDIPCKFNIEYPGDTQVTGVE